VVTGQVTDFVDLRHLIESVDPDWFSSGKSAGVAGTRVMIAENSPMARGLLRSYFEMAGFEVVEAAGADEALRRLNRQRVDVLILSLDLPGETAFDLLRRIREATELRALPVICLGDEPDRLKGRVPAAYEFDECVSKFDQQAMLASVSRLAGALRSRESELQTVSARRAEC
jgi:DNA-binding response OmpR family regulator